MGREVGKVFERISEAGTQISGDPELRQLQEQAVRHFSAYLEKRKEEKDRAAEYELTAVRQTLGQFDSVRELKSEYLEE